MKTWFEKFRASTALDRGDKSPKPGQSDEARCFAESLRVMERDLQEAREVWTKCDVPSDLHASVMREVRKAGMVGEPAIAMLWLRRLAATALVLTVGVGVFWSVNRPSGKMATDAPPSLTIALDQGHKLTQAAPKTVLGALSSEMDLLDQDLQSAVTFLADCVPSVD